MKKKIIIASVLAAFLIASALVYFIAVRPMMNSSDSQTSQNSTFLVFDRVERERISSIEVHNSHGEYTLKKAVGNDGKESATNFVIKGHEDILLSDQSVASLVVASGISTAYQCLTEDATEEELETYGLDEPQAYWILTDVDGKTYRVEVGDKLLSGNGFYCRYMDRENSIYVMSAILETSILAPVTTYVNPVLCTGISEKDYYTADKFTILRDGEQFLTIVQSDKEEFTNPNATVETHIEYPIVEKSNDTVYNTVIASLVTLTGTEAVYVGDIDTDEDKYAEYGLDDPYYSVGFSHNDTMYFFMFSSKTEDGYYYAMSSVSNFSVIVRCEASSLQWLEKELDYWVSENSIQFAIGTVKSVSLEYGDKSETFYLSHSVAADGSAMVEITNGEGFYLDDDSSYLFKKFYVTLLTVKTQGSSGLSAEDIEKLKEDGGAHMLTVVVSLTDGSSHEYSFYRYTTGKALITIDGEGDFYVYPDWVEKIISDLERLLNFEWIDPYSKN